MLLASERKKARVKEGYFYKAAFISIVRRPRGTADVSCHVDTDTSLPGHLMFSLTREEGKLGNYKERLNVKQGMLFLCLALFYSSCWC